MSTWFSKQSALHEKLFDYIRNNVLAVTPNLIGLTDLTQTMISYMTDLGIKETKESFRTHLCKKLELPICHDFSWLI